MISTFINQILDLVASAGPWVYVIVAIAAIAEGAAFFGLVFPGETTLIVAGAATATSDLKLSILIPIAIIGAIIGDSTGYEIGRILGPRLRTSRAGRRVSEAHWNKAEEFIHKYGAWAVFLGHFVAVLRALVPAIAGTMRMKYGRFLLGNALGAAIWAPGALIVGRIASDNLERVEKIISQMGYSFFLLLIVIVTLLIIRRRKKRAKVHQQSTDQSE